MFLQARSDLKFVSDPSKPDGSETELKIVRVDPILAGTKQKWLAQEISKLEPKIYRSCGVPCVRNEMTGLASPPSG